MKRIPDELKRFDPPVKTGDEDETNDEGNAGANDIVD